MIPRTMLFRRTLVAAAVGAGVALPGRPLAWFRGHNARSGRAALAALCSRLDCPATVGLACRKALPPAEAAEPALARALIASLRLGDARRHATYSLAKAIRRQSRDDFRTGQIIMVDGWMLSLTEARLYALSALIAPNRIDAT